MEKVLIVCSCVIVLSLNLVCGQSPCPDIFDYESDGANIYGKIVLRPSAAVSQLAVRANFTVATQLFNNYVGRIDAEDNNRLLQKYNQGLPVQYRVHFPVSSPLPKLTALSVNGATVCYGPGDIPRPNQYVTTLSLQHTSFLQGGASLQPQYQNTLDIMEFVVQLGDDAFTYNKVDNTPNHGNSPYYIVNSSSRPMQPIQPVHHQTNEPFHKKPTRPSVPVYTNLDPFEQGYEDRTEDRYPVRPMVQKPPVKPIYPRPMQEPMYHQPAAKPTSPEHHVDMYYPQEQTTQKPGPEYTSRPAPQQPQSSQNMECGTIAGGNEHLPLIYNGNPYERGDLPWLVAIYKSRGSSISFICGGTLVSDRHVVTAAHCMQMRKQLTSIESIVVKVGVHNLNDWSDDITVTRNLMAATIHESYNASTLDNDLLLFTLDKPVEFNTYIRPACLWDGPTDQSRVVGASGVVAGWGEQSAGGGGVAGEPRLVRLPIVSTAACRASKPDFHYLTSANTLCAGDRNGAGPCNGDSGGGLYILDNGKWRLRGVVSRSLRPENGDRTCNLDEYIVFTDTAQYLSWLKHQIRKDLFN